MQQVKIFKTVESELNELESEINNWIKTSGAKNIQLTGNIAPQTEVLGNSGGAAQGIGGSLRFPPSDVMVIITYETDE